MLRRHLYRYAFLILFGINAAFGQCPGMVFAHLVDGSGWKSSIYLMNGSATSADYTLKFRGDSGQPALLSFADGRRDNQISGAIDAGGIAVLETPGTDSDPLTVASAMLTGTSALSGFAVIRERQPGGPDREATIAPISPSARGLAFPFDNSGGYGSSIAITAPCGPTPAIMLTAVATDESGAALGHAELKMQRGGHLAFLVGDQFPASKGKRGLVRVSVAGPQSANVFVAGIGLRFTPAGALAGLPPIPLPASAPAARPAVRSYAKKRPH